MAGFIESWKNFWKGTAYFIAALLCFSFIGAIGYAAWYFHKAEIYKQQTYELKAELVETRNHVKIQDGQIKSLTRNVKQKEAAMALMRLSHRVAQFYVTEQEVNDAQNILTSFRLVEFDRDGARLGESRNFTIEGEQAWFDYLVAKFLDKYVESGDLVRGSAVFILQGVFGNKQAPDSAVPIDEAGKVPDFYMSSPELAAAPDLIQTVIDDCWKLAHDPELAASLGIRAIHKQAVSMELQAGYLYTLTVRSDGEMSITSEKWSGLFRDEVKTEASSPANL